MKLKIDKSVEVFRNKWPRGKLSLLASHLFYAIDETRDWGGWIDTKDMDEAEKMFLELFKDLNKLIPEFHQKVDVKLFESEILEEEKGEDDDLL